MATLVDKLSHDEMSILFRRKSVKDMARILGLSQSKTYQYMRQEGFQTGKESLKGLSQVELVACVAIHGSFKAVAKCFACSEAFVKNLCRAAVGGPSLSPGIYTPGFVQEKWDRTGSVALTAILLAVSETDFRAYVKKHNLVKPDCIDVCTALSHQFGRKAEVDFRQFRELGLDMDRTYGDPNHPYDIDDHIFKRVNVKGSNVAKYKSRRMEDKEYWKFDLKGADDCDWFALMFYRKSKLVRILMVPTNVAKARHTTTLIVNSKNLSEMVESGTQLFKETDSD